MNLDYIERAPNAVIDWWEEKAIPVDNIYNITPEDMESVVIPGVYLVWATGAEYMYFNGESWWHNYNAQLKNIKEFSRYELVDNFCWEEWQ